MKYSREKINKAGKIIKEEMVDVLAYAEAMSIVDNWRKDHLPVLEHLTKEITAIFDSHGVRASFSSSRLKRMTSIKSKLLHNPEMGLGGVQDIGGARYVFNNIGNMRKAQNILEKQIPDNFTLEKAPYDYVTEPKSSGYRSVHFVYKYHSDEESLNGKRIELQLRTKLQHDWATAVETAEILSKTALKAGTGDKEWHNFFKLTGAIFALMENQPTSSEFIGYTLEDYCKEYGRQEERHKFTERLRAAFISAEITESQSIESGYILLVSDIENKKISIRHFEESNTDEASELYARTETSLKGNTSIAVLVSVKDLFELRQAYPSYFLNAREFLKALSEFTCECRIKGYIE